MTPPNSATSFRDLPDEDQIGGYPNAEQLSQSDFDPATLDSEGRCVILEFPAFVLIGTYCPAERDETRTHFRTGFLQVLDSRIRNLVALGKRVIWTGDLNISREEIDTAAAEESMRKNGVDSVGWISTPARRMFNQLLVGGKVHGERDEGRERQIMWDVCRGFHEGRKGMYTCWETKTNARPGNFGARIDYVVCSHDMKDWFSESNIQEGLMGSDHCPLYAMTKDMIMLEGGEKHILDIVNPPGMFEAGVRKEEWSTKNLLPMSGKLIQEFDRRRNIRDMFTRTPSMPKGNTTVEETAASGPHSTSSMLPMPSLMNGNETRSLSALTKTTSVPPTSAQAINGKRRTRAELPAPASKRGKSTIQLSSTNGKGQQSLKGFFASKTGHRPSDGDTSQPTIAPEQSLSTPTDSTDGAVDNFTESPTKTESLLEDEAATFASKQSWGKLFARPIAPKCEHDEPCKTMLTKKPGANCGRSFWMCNRPLGPSGRQEKGTQWRCNTFIWCSDWDTHAHEAE